MTYQWVKRNNSQGNSSDQARPNQFAPRPYIPQPKIDTLKDTSAQEADITNEKLTSENVLRLSYWPEKTALKTPQIRRINLQNTEFIHQQIQAKSSGSDIFFRQTDKNEQDNDIIKEQLISADANLVQQKSIDNNNLPSFTQQNNSELLQTPNNTNQNSSLNQDSEEELIAGRVKPEGGVPDLQSKIRNSLVNRKKEYDTYMEILGWIDKATIQQRRNVLKDRELINLLKTKLQPNFVHVISANLLRGSQVWRNPEDNDFYQHFVERKSNNSLPANASMNCWEMVLYSAYLVGLIKPEKIRSYYFKSSIDGINYENLVSKDPFFKFLSSTNVNDEMTKSILRNMTWKEGLPYHPDYSPNRKKGSKLYEVKNPRPGDFLFFRKTTERIEAPQHVAIAINNDEAVSLTSAFASPNQQNVVERIFLKSYMKKNDGFIQVGNSIKAAL
ncbi:MAG TPA: hypothetical protein VK184_03250 [Nostocaceae cyanobacterium]|nr:hypothetical protein [Nostocaceae cyanobacterium]